ncbi:hypothetical protein ACF1DY_37885, partial [Streptomyces albus]
MAASDIVRAFVAFAAVFESVAVDAIYVVQSSSKWGAHLAEREPVAASTFRTQATSLGFCEREAGKMWSKLAQICVIAGATTEALTSAEYVAARAQFHSAVVAKVGRAPKSLNAPLFGLDALMFHRGQGPRPHPRKRWAARSVPEIGWDRAEECAPVMVATMRRYLDQIGISLRVSSVDCIETTLRQFAGHLATT